MDRKEHEYLPDDVIYHLVDEQCRKKNQEPQPKAEEQCRKKSQEPFPRRDFLYHQDYHEVKKYQRLSTHAKHYCAANSRHDSDSEDDTEEADDTPLTKADIPTIVDAVLSNISTEGTSTRDDNQDNSHLGEQAS